MPSKTELIASCTEEVKPLVRNRAVLKRKITVFLQKLNELLSDNELKNSMYQKLFKEINSCLDKIKLIDDQMLVIFDKYNIEDIAPEYYSTEANSQTDYIIKVNFELDSFSSFDNSDNLNASNSSESNNEQLIAALKNLNHTSESRPPPLLCSTFDGTGVDKFEFNNFLVQFSNVIDCRKNLTDSAKLAYLHSYLKGYAFKIVKHLSITDANYPIALDLLKQEFLDEEYLIDEIYKKIMHSYPAFDSTYNTTRLYINEIKSYLFELKNFGFDFIEEKSPGNSFVSHVIFSKLPLPFKLELIHKVSCNYPTLEDIFDNYNELIKVLVSTKPKNFDKNANKGKTFVKPCNVNKDAKENKTQIEKPSTLSSYKTNASKSKQNQNVEKVGANSNFKTYVNKPCKFCSTSGHSMNKCDKFIDYDSRVKRCNELNFCIKCTSTKHKESECPGSKNELDFQCIHCKQFSHIAALCNNSNSSSDNSTISNLCLNSNHDADKLYILPTVTIRFSQGNKHCDVRCLIDSGSQRSYISQSVAAHLCNDVNELHNIKFDIQTFIGNQERNFKQTSLELKIGNQHKIHMPLLIDENLSLKFEVSGINLALQNLNKLGLKLADSDFNVNSDNSVFHMHSLIGADVLQFFPSFSLQKCMNGSCFEFENKIIPFGNVEHFLYKDQLRELHKQNIIKNKTEVNSTIVNLVLNPVKSYFNPLECLMTDSEIDHGLENIFNLESIGIKNANEDLTNFDKLQIESFKNDIVFENNRYHVKLPWYEDKLPKVPSNSKIALKVLERVVSKLDAKNLKNDYEKVFLQHLNDGIIEKIEIDPSNYDKYIWIPHRPVIKMEAQVTTKIRPAFLTAL